MLPGRIGQGRPRIRRVIVVVCATAATFFATAAVANAATYFVDAGGADVGDCPSSAPCATIQYAIERHRTLTPADPSDVISVGPGDFAQNVDATAPQDDGLTIRGALGPTGAPATLVTGDGAGITCGFFPCIVGLGSDADDANATLENVAVNQTTLTPAVPPARNPSPILLQGGSDLDTVGSTVSLDDTFAAVELCNVPGSDIVNSFLDARNTDADGVNGCAEIDIRDTGIFTDDGRALDVPGTPGQTSVITRSWLSASETSPTEVASVDCGLTVDSSIISWGATALTYPGNGDDVLINNSTLDAAMPWDDDGESLFVNRNVANTNVTIDSSILVDEIVIATTGEFGSLSCEYTNLDDVSEPDPPYFDDCPPADDPGSTNTDENPFDIFTVGTSSDWELQPDAPAIDSGQPGPLFPGESTTDFDGNPRLVPGTNATCPGGVRDQGAYEAPAVTCAPPGPTMRTLTVSTTGTGAGTVTGPGINCGAGGTDCTRTVPNGTTIELTATAADGSSFDGFSGGGCSTSPCTVTMDGNRSVQAAFHNTRAGTRTLRVSTSGAGGGVVTGPGINCGTEPGEGDCTQSYSFGESVELRANADGQSILGAFTGSGCEDSPCTVTMDASRSVVARFDRARIPQTRFARRPHRAERNPVFRMRSSQPRSTFECRVDSGDWEECERRVVLRGLDAGRHVFRARATNRFDVTGPPNRATFRVRG